MKDCVLFSKLSDNTVQCLACNHGCIIRSGRVGICGVRKNYHGTLKLLVWDKPTGVAIDPIEKKPLYHFLPGSSVFSLGTFGCNFGCLFCQNSMTSQLTKTADWKTGYTKFLNQLDQWSPKKIVSYCCKFKIPSIAFTYNEPTIFAEYAIDIMKLAKKKGIYGIFVTNGYQSRECLDYVSRYIDAYNIDLKSFREQYYQQVCKARLQPILDTITRIRSMKKWLEITTLVVVGKNDSDEELRSVARFISSVSPDIPWHISACYPHYKMTDIPVTPKQTLERAYIIGKSEKLNYIYLGNIPYTTRGHSYCPSCRSILIERNGYVIISNNIKKGSCPYCQTAIPGIWQ